MENSVNLEINNTSNKKEPNYKKIVSELKRLINIFYKYDDSSMILLKDFMNDVSKFYTLIKKNQITEEKYNELKNKILKNIPNIKLRFNNIENMLSIIINAINQDFIEVEETYNRVLRIINGPGHFNIEKSNEDLLILRSFIKEGIFLKNINEDLKKIYSNFLKEVLMLEQVLISINNYDLIKDETSTLRKDLTNRLYNLIDWYTYFIDKIALILRESNVNLEELKNQSEELARNSTNQTKIRDLIIARAYLMKSFFEKIHQEKLAFKIVDNLLYPFPKENIGGETDSWILFRDNAMNDPISNFGFIFKLDNGYALFVYNHKGKNAIGTFLRKEELSNYNTQYGISIKSKLKNILSNETEYKNYLVDIRLLENRNLKIEFYSFLAKINNTHYTTLRSLFSDDKTLQLRPSKNDAKYGLDKLKTLAYVTKTFVAREILKKQGINIEKDLSLKERYEMMFGNLIINGKKTENELKPYYRYFSDYLGVLISDISEINFKTLIENNTEININKSDNFIFIGSYLRYSPFWSVAISKFILQDKFYASIFIRYPNPNDIRFKKLEAFFKAKNLIYYLNPLIEGPSSLKNN